MNRLPRESDVVVVGGGPAGLAAAIAARRRGFTVTVADSARTPIDKACGEGIMPDGVEALRALGITIDGDEGFPFRGIRFVDGNLSAEATFGIWRGRGVRRAVLHRILAAHAQDLGVTLRWETPVRMLDAGSVGIGGRAVHCRWIVGADGQNSRIRQWAGFGPAPATRRRQAVRQHFRIKPWTDFVEVHWRQHCQAYITPVAADQICVALVGSSLDRPLRMTDFADLFPALAGRLKDALPTSSPRGALSLSTRPGAVFRDRTVLIGDASAAVDAVTGEGLSMAFRQALALGEAMAANDLRRYQAAHRRIARPPRMMAQLLLAMDGRTRLRHSVLRALAARPHGFSRLLAVHVGALGPASMLVDVAGLAGWMLVAGAFAALRMP